jgi:hypothetical protein
MRALVIFLAASTLLSSCRPSMFRRGDPAPAASDSLYWKALLHLDAQNRKGSTDSAIKYLDAYLARDTTQKHRLEALVLRRLARDAMQLARVEAALQVARSAEPARAADSAPAPRRDEEMVKEIQRLKEELAKANEELERIKKRLAAPKPPNS